MNGDISSQYPWLAPVVWPAIERLKAATLDICQGSVEFSFDDEELEKTVKKARGSDLNDHFRLVLHELPPCRLMWIHVRDPEGATIAVVATRLDEIEGWSLKQFLQRRVSRAIEAKGGGFARLTDDTSEFAANWYPNRVGYSGQGWVHKDWRRSEIGTFATQIILLAAFERWDLDLVYGWMESRYADRGMATSWGAARQYRQGLSWAVEPAIEGWKDALFVGCDIGGIHSIVRDVTLRFPRIELNSSTPPRTLAASGTAEAIYGKWP
ncbi:MAG: hypothetical protein AAF468_06335 [Pseudomonadota bacterium]